jgi:hypothetical protein
MAAPPREIEVKRLLIGERAGDRLLAALAAPVVAEKRQVNHVLDTKSRALSAARLSLRLRNEDGEWIVTAKGPSQRVAGSTASKVEAESHVEAAVAGAILGAGTSALDVLRARIDDSAFDELWQSFERVLADQPLIVVGSFENERRVVPVILPSGSSLTLEIDRTRFPGGRVDEEVEIELDSAALAAEVEAWLETTARAAGVVTAPSSAKIARFLDAAR